ncbi:DUF1834 family protein [Luteibacter aegosomatis]|uniref:phage protein Gp37 n=1 Tax=Luteibacter aegosomatis TaxID=2911537 RepID=UPI001FFB3774|nr:phage protein Gp37 [Luteibacter aegosomatis]UPG87026.1 DUF1834 family protein [Luteibacter aegosomatis]
MLDLIESAVLDRLQALKEIAPRIDIAGYAGELSDGDLLAKVAAAGMAVLVLVPSGKFTRRSNRRFSFDGVVRLVIFVRQARGQSETRMGTAGQLGSYALWDSCVRLLTDFHPSNEAAGLSADGLVPTTYNNLVNGKAERDYLSVLGQSFAIKADWTVPEDAGEPLLGIDLNYYLKPGDDLIDASDHVPLENT